MPLIVYAGKSMSPTMPRFGFLWYQKQDSLYQVGDIIVFIGNDKKRYCHRIAEIDYQWDQKFTTKGDAFNKSRDYEINVPIKNILGKVIKWF